MGILNPTLTGTITFGNKVGVTARNYFIKIKTSGIFFTFNRKDTKCIINLPLNKIKIPSR
ncbi:hypothetical protein AYY17_14205 [Morganella psychrotolerans]|uniref:Uncharacterized protein n=1 Tax=Morganella psychrotolerans TaxID=368603 RepID=A0A1B8HMN4_9GAMM|nr:hypothetical protein AYY17_14205 [Morganella psychrotolerans]